MDLKRGNLWKMRIAALQNKTWEELAGIHKRKPESELVIQYSLSLHNYAGLLMIRFYYSTQAFFKV